MPTIPELAIWERVPTERILRVLEAKFEPTDIGLRSWQDGPGDHCCPFGIAFWDEPHVEVGHPDPKDVVTWGLDLWREWSQEELDADGDGPDISAADPVSLREARLFAKAFDEGRIPISLLQDELREIVASRQ